ncbi:flagellar basal-body MS-ring/collar protein FliF [Clostridium hydrogeniformans]|uniref:flagellar basal-body MS-ring/collar protein FliF n=1 Tax=Clostridium hydrogeniformans TaxID=349933 RepID=UPI000484386E|nr:flagellar basal-body MS-ring/collar protein FliF [Clostridium hydrogeniformans]
MGKLKEGLSKIKDKFMSLSKSLRIGVIVLISGIIISLIFLGVYLQNNKYGLLFSGLDGNDAKSVTEKLKEKKVETKVKGDSIYVPKDKVDELRLELATDITNGSKGYELMDNSQSFGMTDEEFKIKKQRVLQGEIEKTIKSFPQIKNARVHLTPPEESVFVKESKPGKASVYIEMKPSSNLSKEQVKSIVSLVGGATSNTPKESIEVIDEKMNLLSRDLFEDDKNFSSSSLEKQKKVEEEFENKLQTNVLEMLEPVVGKGKVKVKVNSELDFDAKEKTDVVVNPQSVVVSEATSKETSSENGGRNNTQSPVDNNMTNAINNNNGNATSSKEDKKTNYEVGKSETKVISAPGAVKRLTASVVVDGNLDIGTQETIKGIVSNAIGFKQDRGDEISVASMAFDPQSKDAANKALEEMKKEEEQAKKMRLYKIIALSVGILILVITVIVALIIKHRRNNEDGDEEELDEEGKLNVLIGDNIEPKEQIKLDPIDFEVSNEKIHLENEVKRYAKDKPEQFVDIVKAWLAEDER